MSKLKPVTSTTESTKSKRPFYWVEFFFGCAVGAILGVAVTTGVALSYFKDITKDYSFLSSVNTPADDTPSNTTPTTQPTTQPTEAPNYQTGIKEWTINAEDGTTFNFHTPTDWYSLTDQYTESLDSYYMMTLPKDNAVCVGNNRDQYSATNVINVRPLSEIKKVLQEIYGDDYDEETMLFGDAYTYMKTGELSEESEEYGVTVDLLEAVTINDIEFSIFQLGYDTEYYTDETQEETFTEHTDELVCYTSNEDALEIILYMQEFDAESGLVALKEFIGAE